MYNELIKKTAVLNNLLSQIEQKYSLQRQKQPCSL